MNAKQIKEPAFPLNELDQTTGNICAQHVGITARDYFAARAMQSILSHLDHGIRPQDCIVMAEDAYTVADAMMVARELRITPANEGTMDENQIEEWTRTMRRASEEIDLLRGDVAALYEFWKWAPDHVHDHFIDQECKPTTADRIARIAKEMEKSC